MQWQDEVRDYVTRSKYAHRTFQYDGQIINMSTAALHKRFLPTDTILSLFNQAGDGFQDLFGRYPPIEGHIRFREEIEVFLNEKGASSTKEQIIITSGSQLGVHLIAETFWF